MGDIAKFIQQVILQLEKEWEALCRWVWDILPAWIHQGLLWIYNLWEYLGDKIWSFFMDPVQFVKSGLEWVYEKLPGWVKSIFDWFWRIYWGVGEAIYNFFTNPVEALKGLGEKIWRAIPDWVKAPLEWLKKLGDLEVKLIIGFFTDPVGTLRELADIVWGVIPDWLKDWIKGAKETADKLWENVPKWIDSTKEKIGEIGSTLEDRIKDAKDTMVSAFDGAQTAVSEALEKWIGRPFSDFVKTLAEGAGGLWDGIYNFFTKTLPGAADTLSTLFQARVIRPMMERLGGAGQALAEWVKGVFKPFIDALMGIFKPGKKEPEEVISELLMTAIGCISTMELATIAFEAIIPFKHLGLGGAFGSAIATTIVGSVVGGVVGATAGPVWDFALVKWIKERIRGGYPSLEDALWMWHRGIISEEDVNQIGAWSGLDDKWIEAYKKHSWRIPGASDLIRFFVREAYPPVFGETARAKLVGFPDEFAELLEKVGFERVWAESYWAAHWVLPTTSQVYEMLWRGLPSPYTGATMTEEDVKTFLREADIDPRWRENLVQIAYKLPGRILARWGVEWGVWTPERMEEFLRAEGIHPDWIPDAIKAEKANIFREHISAVASVIKRKYREGYLTYEEANQRLEKLSYPEEARVLMLEAMEEEYDLDWKEDMKKAYISAYRDDKMTADELRAALLGLGIRGDRVDKIVEIETLKKEKRAPAPETLERRLESLRNRRRALMEKLMDLQSDLEDQKKLLEAELRVWEERIAIQEERVRMAPEEKKPIEEKKLETLKRRMALAKLRREARIGDIQETIEMLSQRIDDLDAEIKALEQTLGKPTAS